MSGDWRSFHITLHVRPPGNWSQRTWTLDGRETRILDLPPSSLDIPFPVSFEQALASLSQLPRLFIEPDGSFVWVSERGSTPPWQIDGLLFDRGGRLLYVELKGDCPMASFTELLKAFESPATTYVVLLVRSGVVMDMDVFCGNWDGKPN
jgi:hypothetical protein